MAADQNAPQGNAEAAAQQAARAIAVIRELTEPGGRVWELTTACAGLADHAWLERDRLLSLSDGAAELRVVWQGPEGPVELKYEPSLPAAARPAGA